MKILAKKIALLLLSSHLICEAAIPKEIEIALYKSSADGSGILSVQTENTEINEHRLIEWFRSNWLSLIEELDKVHIAGHIGKQISHFAVIALAEELDDEEYLNFVERCVSDDKLRFFTAEKMLDLIKGQNRRFGDIPSNYKNPRVKKIIAQAKTRFTGDKAWLEEIEQIELGKTKMAMEKILDMNGLSSPKKFRNQTNWLLISAASILLVALLLILTKKIRRSRLR